MKNLNGVVTGVLTVTAGVLVAGYVMSMFKDIGVVADAHRGFDS